MAPSARLETLVTTIAVALSLFMNRGCCGSILEDAVDIGISLPLTLTSLELCMLTSDLDYTNGAVIAQADTCKRWVIQGLVTNVSFADAAARGVQCAQMNGLNFKFAQCLDRAVHCPALVQSVAAVIAHLPIDLLNLGIQGSNGLISTPISLLNLQKCMFISNLDYTNISAVLQADTCKAWVMQGLLTGISTEDAYRKGAKCAQRNNLPELFQLCLRSACQENSLIQNFRFFGFNLPLVR